jgi:hypothetical protein
MFYLAFVTPYPFIPVERSGMASYLRKGSLAYIYEKSVYFAFFLGKTAKQ